jgi:hypothetical protein
VIVGNGHLGSESISIRLGCGGGNINSAQRSHLYHEFLVQFVPRNFWYRTKVYLTLRLVCTLPGSFMWAATLLTPQHLNPSTPLIASLCPCPSPPLTSSYKELLIYRIRSLLQKEGLNPPRRTFPDRSRIPLKLPPDHHLLFLTGKKRSGSETRCRALPLSVLGAVLAARNVSSRQSSSPLDTSGRGGGREWEGGN